MSTTDTRLRFLGHFNGSDASKTIADDSTYTNTVTNNSVLACELDTGVKKYGTASLMCDLIVKDSEVGTDSTQIVITGHGLSVNDKITVKNVISAGDSFETTVASVIDSDTFTIADINFQKFGSACGKFDGTGDYLSIPDHSDFDFGSGDFTIESWVYFTSVAAQYKCIYSHRGSIGNLSSAFYAYYDDGFQLFYSTNGSGWNVASFLGTNILSTNTWYHVELSRSGSNLRCFLNGVQIGSTHNIGTSTIFNSSATIKIGMVDTSSFPFAGYMDEFRVLKGVASHTADFSVPTSEYTSDSNTSLLLHMNGTSGSTTFTDDGNTVHTVTANGDAQLYSASTNGDAEYVHYYHEKKVQLALPSNNLQDNVTFRFWFRRNDGYPAVSGASNSNILGYDSSGTQQIIYLDTNNKINVEGLQSTTTINADTWYFVQYSATTNKHWLHIDGTLEDSATLTTPKDYTSITNFVLFDETANDNNLDSTTSQAWLDDLQIWETALYGNDNFTAPTSEYSDSEFTSNLYLTNYGLQVDIKTAPPNLYVTNYGLQVDIKTAPPNLYVTNYGLQVDIRTAPSDTDPPVITALDPESGDQQIALTKSLEITFDENVIAQSGKNITIYDQGANIFEQIDVTNAKVTVTDNVVTINPAGIFQYGTLYYVLLDAGAFQDASGNPTSAITDPAYWNFLTKINNFSDAVIEIGGVDYTNQADLKSCRIIKQDNFDNQATVNIVMNTNAIKMGMEMKIRDTVTSEILFGGLIRDPQKVLLSPDFMVLNITADGYKQILGRRTFSVDVQNDFAGNTVSQIFDNYLKTGGTYTSEGLSEGNIDNGATIENYVTIAKSGLKIFNDFANASGYKWWITDYKDFYFQSAPTYIDNTTTKKLTPDKTDSAYIRCVDMPVFNEDSSQFRTRQFVVGKTKDDTTILGSYTDSTAETEMSSRYGSGVYGSVMTSRDISTTAEANTLAETEVKTYVNPASINFKTFDKIEPLELIKVDISLLGISNETYKITKVTKTIQPDFRILSDIVAEKYVASTKTKRNWTDDFDEMIKNNSADEDDKEIKYDEIVGGTSITSVAPDTRTLSMTVDTDKTLNIGYSIVGTCAVASTITVTVAIDAVTKKVFTWDVPIGNFSKEIYFPIRTITTSKSGASITAVTSTTQTLTIAGTDLTFWGSLS